MLDEKAIHKFTEAVVNSIVSISEVSKNTSAKDNQETTLTKDNILLITKGNQVIGVDINVLLNSLATINIENEISLLNEIYQTFKEQLKAVIDNLPFMVWLKDSKGRFVLVNEQFSAFCGIDEKNIIGKTDADFCSPEVAARYLKEDEEILIEGKQVHIEEYVKNDFTEGWFETYKRPVYNEEGKIIGTTGFARNINNRKIAELRIKESEEKFRNMAENIRDGIIIIKNNEIVFCNKQMLHIFRLNQSLTSMHDWLMRIDDADIENRQVIQNGLTGGKLPNEILLKLVSQNYIYCRFTSSKDINEERNIYIIATDITKQIEANNKLQNLTLELQNLNKNLEKRIKEEVENSRNKDLVLYKQSKQAAMGEMIGNIAHQWRQPLNAVGIIIQNIQEAFDYGELTEEYLAQKVEKSMTLIKQMSETIDNFRSFFKTDSIIVEFSVNDAIIRALEFLSASLINNNIEVKFDFDDNYYIYGYQNEFSQVILNLLHNAKETLRTNKIVSPNIFISLIRINDDVVITIEDNAGGIDDALIDRIFEPYFTTKEQGEGSGLGLYLTKTFIEHQMNGSVSAENGQYGLKIIIKIKSINN